MRATIVLAVVGLAASASAVGYAVPIAKDIHAYPAYKFSYGVSDKISGDQKSHYEERDGGVVKGSYSLVQPDGILRTVNYISTPHGGFQAQVINKGISHHPAIVHKPVVPVVGFHHGIGHHGLHHGPHHGHHFGHGHGFIG